MNLSQLVREHANQLISESKRIGQFDEWTGVNYDAGRLLLFHGLVIADALAELEQIKEQIARLAVQADAEMSCSIASWDMHRFVLSLVPPVKEAPTD